MPGSEDVLKKQTTTKNKTTTGTQKPYVGRTQEPTERAPGGQSWNNLSDKRILDYNPKYKMSIYESILSQINH